MLSNRYHAPDRANAALRVMTMFAEGMKEETNGN